MRRALKLRWLAVVALLAALIPLAAAGGTAGAAAGTGGPGACQTVSIPVALAPGQPANQRISGSYCTPYGEKPSTVDVLMHGFTYNDTYWNDLQSGNPVPGSYEYMTLEAGRATLAISMLGSGQSSSPPGLTLTAYTAAYALHQVVTWVRHHLGARDVDEIGHSLGSVTVEMDASIWPSDPSRVILTGFLNELTPNIGLFLANTRPATSHGVGGYLTTDPGARGTYFYDMKTASQATVAYDEKTKDVGAAGEVSTMAPAFLLPALTGAVTAPVQLVVGQDDDLLCTDIHIVNCSDPGQVLAYEHLFFRDASRLSVLFVPNTGHDIATSTTDGWAVEHSDAWIASTPGGR